MTSDGLFRLCALLVVFCSTVWAECQSYGVDYSNGGSYEIDASSNQYFSFETVFQGCAQEIISPVLVDPKGNHGIPYSSMPSGQWKIILSGQQVAVQRVITLTAGLPTTVTVIATPTVIVGVTSTPKAVTVIRTVTQTQTYIVVPQTVTKGCNDGTTRTITITPTPATVIRTSTAVRTITDDTETSTSFTIITSTAVCHFPTTKPFFPPDVIATPRLPQPTNCAKLGCRPKWSPSGSNGSGGWGWGVAGETAAAVAPAVTPMETLPAAQRNLAAVAAITVTSTETTFTVTRTFITTVPASTTTENVYRTAVTTITPPPTTDIRLVTLPGLFGSGKSPVFAYFTETAYTVITNKASATACWRAGGWFG
ncbi:hypothetical protein JX265_006821 [Neoarthrinium moseri]|uniref:Uncharacterized protein n=1 Tax=Neoarthrinium moseri TaxID=1658444 RepID=A0A9P9WLC0_9PEZI|nr:hypothetical protein JX265_006821 [Neoarthrinium moseri]